MVVVAHERHALSNLPAFQDLSGSLIKNHKVLNSQKAKLRYEKVERRFRGDVKEDKITLHACQTKHSVSSYDLKVGTLNPLNILTLKFLGYSC